MVVPVDNRSYMKKATDRAKTRKLNKKKKNIGAASSFTKKGTPLGRSRTKVDQSDDTGPAKKISSAPKALSQPKKKPVVNPKMTGSAIRTKANPELYKKPERIEQSTSLKAIPNTTYDILGPGAGSKKVQPRINKETPVINKMGGYQDADQLGRARTRLGQSDDTGPSIRTNTLVAPEPVAPEPVAPKPAAPKPAAPKPAAPKPAAKVAPRPRPKPSRLTGGGMDAELLSTPTGVTSGRVKKTAAKPASKDDGYKFYGKEGTGLGDFSRKHGMQYATQKQFEKDFNMDDGEKAGGRPGRGKLKTQGMNKAGKRKAGFSGRGSGAALRGF